MLVYSIIFVQHLSSTSFFSRMLISNIDDSSCQLQPRRVLHAHCFPEGWQQSCWHLEWPKEISNEIGGQKVVY